MNQTTIITDAEIEAAARALIRARKTNLGVEVTMPVVYPTGQMVNVVITVQGGDYLVHDAGFGAMCLTSAGVQFTAQLERRLSDLGRHYGCEFVEGRMSRRASESQLALATVMVANASRTVGDQMIYIRKQHETDFRKAVTERTREVVGKRLREDEEVYGFSGRMYRVHNVILDTNERHAVAFLLPLQTRSLVQPHFAEFWDLLEMHPSVENDSVYDEAGDFRPEDRKLLERVSKMVPLEKLPTHLRQRWIA